MSILVDENTLLIVQGITGREGSYQTAQMIAYGTQVAGGSGTMYKWLGGKVYVLGTNGWWYVFTGSVWSSVSQQEPGTAPTTRVVPWPKQQGQQNALLDTQRSQQFYLRRIDGNSATFGQAS